MSSNHEHTEITAASVTLPANSIWSKLHFLGAPLAVIGLALTYVFRGEGGEGIIAYLIAYMYFISFAIGGLFFIFIYYLTRASWGTSLRRLAEKLAITMPAFAVLFIPIAMNMEDAFLWAKLQAGDHGEHHAAAEPTGEDADADQHAGSAHAEDDGHGHAPAAAAASAHHGPDPLLEWKKPYLNKPFFLARALFYLGSLSLLAIFFVSSSVRQDSNGDPNITRRLQAMAAPGIAVGALASTFMAFDWMMSTDYHWFSTMYGVIYFAGAFMSCFAILTILVNLMGENRFAGTVNVEHRHSAAKMMWGLNVFWTYTSFSQFMLMWYANIPEETMWYDRRWSNGWEVFSIILFFGHFLIPFFGMMSRHVKRSPTAALGMAVWLLVMHYLDIFWQIKPNMNHGHGVASLGLVEIAALVGVGGVFLVVFGAALSRGPIIPVRDPRLAASIAHQEQ